MKKYMLACAGFLSAVAAVAAAEVPEKETDYPEAFMFDMIPLRLRASA